MGATRASVGDEQHVVGRPLELPGLPKGLFVAERPPTGGWGSGAAVAILVHGSLDRSWSFARVARRLGDLGVVTYDRRGYQHSRAAPVSDDLGVHIDDLLQIAAAVDRHRAGGRGVVAVGHSVGATIVLGAAVASPEALRAVGAYEASMPWLGFHRRDAPGSRTRHGGAADPGLEAERFFRRMVGDAAWERLGEEQREGRRRDGPALLADLRAIRSGTPFDVTTLSVPAIVSSGGAASFPHHRDTVDWLASHVPAARRSTIPEAGHGAHLSHPDAFAALVREVAGLASRAAAAADAPDAPGLSSRSR
ncbi:MAG: alpha/beta hydrolase [Actinomycetota bacterium]|nr:alpha/beta hydrolase [Actinomycetota bacterium]